MTKIIKQLQDQEWYQALIEDCQSILTEGIWNYRLTLIKTYHILGKRILEDRNNFTKAGYLKESSQVTTLTGPLKQSQRTLERVIQFVKKFPDLDMLPEEGKNISWHKICNKLLPEPDIKKKKWQRYFDVWNFSVIDKNYGVDCPGRIPYEIVANTLYYFTKENDLVVDPMAGGGVLIDVCKEFKRRYLAYDIEIRRSDIKQKNLQEGFAKEAQNCDLIFVDPPYWKKKKEEYAPNSISSFSRKDYLDFFKELASKCKETLKPKGHLAFLMSNYIDYNDPKNSIFTADYYKIFKEAGFVPVIEIQCPLSTEQYRGYDVDRAKKEKKLLIISRSLYIFQNNG